MKPPDLHNKKTQLALGGAGAVVAFALYRKHAATAATSSTAAAGTTGSITDPVASAAFGSSSLENSIVGDLQPQIDALASQLAGVKAGSPAPTPPTPVPPKTPPKTISRWNWLHLPKAAQSLWTPSVYAAGTTQIDAYTFLHRIPKGQQAGWTPVTYQATAPLTTITPNPTLTATTFGPAVGGGTARPVNTNPVRP